MTSKGPRSSEYPGGHVRVTIGVDIALDSGQRLLPKRGAIERLWQRFADRRASAQNCTTSSPSANDRFLTSTPATGRSTLTIIDPTPSRSRSIALSVGHEDRLVEQRAAERGEAARCGRPSRLPQMPFGCARRRQRREARRLNVGGHPRCRRATSVGSRERFTVVAPDARPRSVILDLRGRLGQSSTSHQAWPYSSRLSIRSEVGKTLPEVLLVPAPSQATMRLCSAATVTTVSSIRD